MGTKIADLTVGNVVEGVTAVVVFFLVVSVLFAVFFRHAETGRWF